MKGGSIKDPPSLSGQQVGGTHPNIFALSDVNSMLDLLSNLLEAPSSSCIVNGSLSNS